MTISCLPQNSLWKSVAALDAAEEMTMLCTRVLYLQDVLKSYVALKTISYFLYQSHADLTSQGSLPPVPIQQQMNLQLNKDKRLDRRNGRLTNTQWNKSPL